GRCAAQPGFAGTELPAAAELVEDRQRQERHRARVHRRLLKDAADSTSSRRGIMADFTGQKVLVLCGSSSIGAAIVQRFATGGANVAFSYLGSAEAAAALAGKTGAEAIK